MYIGTEVEIDDEELRKNIEDIQNSLETIKQAYYNLEILGFVRIKKKENTANNG